jgi:hypothetical protein
LQERQGPDCASIGEMNIALVAAGIAVLLAFTGATACRDDKAKNCTLVGCTDGLQVESAGLRANQTIDVCVGENCVSVQAGGGVRFTEIVATSQVVDVRVVVREGGATVSEERRPIPVTVLEPNGEGCPPICKVVMVSVGAAGFR